MAQNMCASNVCCVRLVRDRDASAEDMAAMLKRAAEEFVFFDADAGDSAKKKRKSKGGPGSDDD